MRGESIQQTAASPPKAPTIADVAREADVSAAAASMALRGHSRISVKTKARVEAAAERLGYVANAAARSLREQRAGAIAVVVPHTGSHVFGHMYFMNLLEGITEVANARDSVVVISTNPDAEHGVAAYERVLRSGRTDGAIIASAALDDPYLARMAVAGLPVVVIGNAGLPSGLASVSVPDTAAAFQMCRHLVEVHGHQRIAHISGPVNHQTGRDRLAGYVAAMGTSYDARLVRHGAYDEASGAQAMADLLRLRSSVDAVFCANDEMAFGAMVRANELGRRVPDDLAVVGCDDFGLARVVTPALTTIRVPAVRMGRLASELLFDLLDGQAPRHESVEVEMVWRQSCGCPATKQTRVTPENREKV